MVSLGLGFRLHCADSVVSGTRSGLHVASIETMQKVGGTTSRTDQRLMKFAVGGQSHLQEVRKLALDVRGRVAHHDPRAPGEINRSSHSLSFSNAHD